MKRVCANKRIPLTDLESIIKEALANNQDLKSSCKSCHREKSTYTEEQTKIVNCRMPFELDVDNTDLVDIHQIINWIDSLSICEVFSLNTYQKSRQVFDNEEMIFIQLSYLPCFRNYL